MTFDPLYYENFLEPLFDNSAMCCETQAKKKSLTADSSPVDSVGKVFAG